MPEKVTREIHLKKGAIHCEGCETTIERFLSLAPGVEAVAASERSQAVTVTWDPAVLGVDEVKARLTDMGYPAE